jgi:hypothetical protein
MWDPSWCSGFLDNLPVLLLERKHQIFLLFLLVKNTIEVKGTAFDIDSNIAYSMNPKYLNDWWVELIPSVKMIRLEDNGLDIHSFESDEQVVFLYIIGVTVQNDAITSRLFSRIWRIFLWYVHRPNALSDDTTLYQTLYDVLIKQFYGSPMKREMVRAAKELYSFVNCIDHCIKFKCEKQEYIEGFDLNMSPFSELPKRILTSIEDTLNMSDYKPLIDIIRLYLAKSLTFTSKQLWKKETRSVMDVIELYRPIWKESIDRRYPFLWNTLLTSDRISMINLWGTMLCNFIYSRLNEIIDYTLEEDDSIDSIIRDRLLIRLPVEGWYGISKDKIKKRPLLLCMFEITAQMIMLDAQFKKSVYLFEEIKAKTRPVEHILMGVGKSSVLVPWLTMRILFETELRAVALIQPVHLTDKCRAIVDRVVMPWITSKVALVPVNHIETCNVWWDTPKDTRWIIIGSDSEWKNLYLSVRLHKQKWFRSNELAVIYDEYDSMFAPNKSELNYSQAPQMHPLCPLETHKKLEWIQWYAKTLCKLARNLTYSEKNSLTAFDDTSDNSVRHLQKLKKDLQELYKLKWNRHFGWSNESSSSTIIPYLYVGVPLEGSQFTDVDICLLLTCITYFINGIREKDVQYLKKKWDFMKEIENEKLDTDLLYQVVLHYKMLDTDYSVLNWIKPDLIELYLIQEVLPENMVMINSQWNISFIDMITDSVTPHMVGFSGTVQVKDADLLEKIVFSNINEDTTAYKIMNLALSKNIPKFIDNNIQDIVSYIQGVGIRSNAHCAIIDAGSWFREKTIEEYISDIITHDQNIIVVYLDGNDKSWKQTIKEKTPYTKPYPNEKYLYFYDQRHTVGTDIVLPSKIEGVVTISNTTTFTEVVQGAFRLRSLTSGHQVQMLLNTEVYKEKKITTLTQTVAFLKDNDESRKKGWEYALSRQSIRTRHRLISKHKASTYNMTIYHPSLFINQIEWAKAEFKDFTYPEKLVEYIEEDNRFFEMNKSAEVNLSSNQSMDQDENQNQDQEQEQDLDIVRTTTIDIFNEYEYVSWNKIQYLSEKYPMPNFIKSIFDNLNISISPGLLLCLDKEKDGKITKSYEYTDNWVKLTDLTPEWIYSTSMIVQIKTQQFFLWCTWFEWKLLGYPEVSVLSVENLEPGTERFANFLLRYLNKQIMSHASKEIINNWIIEQSDSFHKFISLWRCKFNNYHSGNVFAPRGC